MMKYKILVISIICVIALALIGLFFVQKTKKETRAPETPVFHLTQTKFTDEDVLDAVYSDYKTPNGFFVDTLERGEKISDSVYYEGVLENNNWIFYCTKDINTAKQLVDKDIADYNRQDNRQDSPDGVIIDTSENEKFFEFKTIENKKAFPDRKYYMRYRVFKCNYLSDLQSGMYYKKDKSVSDNYIGIFAKRPVTTENVKELVEFLWYSAFRNYITVGSKVLSSFTEEDGNLIKHTIFETKTMHGDWGLCDQITLIKSIYTVNKNSGEIKLTEEEIKTLTGNCN